MHILTIKFNCEHERLSKYIIPLLRTSRKSIVIFTYSRINGNTLTRYTRFANKSRGTVGFTTSKFPCQMKSADKSEKRNIQMLDENMFADDCAKTTLK